MKYSYSSLVRTHMFELCESGGYSGGLILDDPITGIRVSTMSGNSYFQGSYDERRYASVRWPGFEIFAMREDIKAAKGDTAEVWRAEAMKALQPHLTPELLLKMLENEHASGRAEGIIEAQVQMRKALGML